MVGFALIVALIISIWVGVVMLSDSSSLGHTYASQKANGKIVGEVSAFIFSVIFFFGF
jgi:hypothetical protein